jgi:hypothetical protein
VQVIQPSSEEERTDYEAAKNDENRLACEACATVPLLGPKLNVESLPKPAGDGSLQPNWSTAYDHSAILSWVEAANDGSPSAAICHAQGVHVGPAYTLADHRHFFRHPAEFPEVLETEKGHWLAHWVETPNEANEVEYVYVSSSTDGIQWTTPLMPHHDRSAVLHGLASLVATGNGEASLMSLEAPKGEDGPAYLMRTIIDSTGKEIREERVYEDVCSCRPTH